MSDDFDRNLIKGKIAEQIFERMFRTEDWEVFRYGYEFTESFISQHQHEVSFPPALDTIRSTPDFIITKNEENKVERKRDVFVVEVKYRSQLLPEKTLETAQEYAEKWKYTHLFIATPTGFYFGSVGDIIASKGNIEPLKHGWVSAAHQENYLKILNEFIN